MPASGEHHPAFEEYCECIFELHEDDVEVIQARIAERLQVSRPAVSEMMKRLEAEGLHGIVLQHEIDHLTGKLFIDRISSLKRELYKRRVKKALRESENAV